MYRRKYIPRPIEIFIWSIYRGEIKLIESHITSVWMQARCTFMLFFYTEDSGYVTHNVVQ
jgi:hypothetical protein